jgi:hypothetical protein
VIKCRAPFVLVVVGHNQCRVLLKELPCHVPSGELLTPRACFRGERTWPYYTSCKGGGRWRTCPRSWRARGRTPTAPVAAWCNGRATVINSTRGGGRRVKDATGSSISLGGGVFGVGRTVGAENMRNAFLRCMGLIVLGA